MEIFFSQEKEKPTKVQRIQINLMYHTATFKIVIQTHNKLLMEEEKSQNFIEYI